MTITGNKRNRVSQIQILSAFRVFVVFILGLFLQGLFPLPISLAHQGVDDQIASMTRRIEKKPNDAKLHLRRAELHRVHRDWEAALKDYNRAAALNSELSEVDLYRGRMYYEAKQPDKAEAALSRFIRKKPEHSVARFWQARNYLKMDQRKKAADAYTQAIALAADPSPDYFIERARALAEGKSPDIEKAIEGLNEGLSVKGPLVTLQLYAIALEMKQMRFDAALTRLDRLADIAGRKDRWLARRGEILETAGRKEEALMAYQSALAAIESLPAFRKNTRSTLALKNRLSKSVVRLRTPTQ